MIEQNSVFLSLPVDQLLAITAYAEAWQDGGEGMMAVLNVIKNRTMFREFYDEEVYNLTGSKYHAVILKPYQFSVFNVGDPGRSTVERLATNFSSEILKNTNLQIAYNLAQMLLYGELKDNTGGSTHYHAYYVSPSWAEQLSFVTRIGNHLFYTSKPELATVYVAGLSPLTVMVLGGLLGLLLFKEG